MPIAFHYVFLILLGLTFGSFGNVLIFRLPRGYSITGRSQCMQCGWQIRPWELIPILSFIVLGGRCRGCRKRISIQYPLVEVATAAIAVFAFWHETFELLPTALLSLSLWLLLLIAVIDLRERMIPDVLNISFIAFVVLWRIADQSFSWGGILVGLFIIGSQWAFSRGKWMGSGDVLLAVGLGALVGDSFAGLLWILFSYMIGSVISLVLLLTHLKTTKDVISFAPFLALGAIAALILEEPIGIFLGL
ncbi:MAG TPA: prepilin peptidase [Candidatus Peribacteraceae bacterium]|nr:prepilin peptidase [Candidatus Peribacteraceae bacterium]